MTRPAQPAQWRQPGQEGGQSTPFYRPIEYRRADILALIDQIREAGANVIAIRITVYYRVK